jgi:hypothetical protein
MGGPTGIRPMGVTANGCKVVPTQACGSGETSGGEQDAPARYSARVGAIEARQASVAAP